MRTSRKFGIATLSLVAAAMVGCATEYGQDELGIKVEDRDTSILLVGHEVASFGSWYPVFTDVGEPLRRSHNASGHRLWQSFDNADYVMVAVEFPTDADMIAFANDPALIDEMTQAGVLVETVTATLSNQYEAIDYTQNNKGWESGATLLVSHEVADFDTWYPIFTQVGGALRLQHGATAHRLFRDLSNPDNVTVHVEFPTYNDLIGFINDPALLEEMTLGGVDTSTIILNIGDEYEWLFYEDRDDQ